jgi:hypothetical protein
MFQRAKLSNTAELEDSTKDKVVGVEGRRSRC